MEILEYYQLSPDRQHFWTEEIRRGDWRAAPYLASQLQDGSFQEHYGPGSRVFLLTDGSRLISFCTLVRQDEIRDDHLFPWIGFVYTFPVFRGHRYSERVILHACAEAKTLGYSRVYLSSNERSLYEKYGFTFLGHMATDEGHETQVFVRELSEIPVT